MLYWSYDEEESARTDLFSHYLNGKDNVWKINLSEKGNINDIAIYDTALQKPTIQRMQYFVLLFYFRF